MSPSGALTGADSGLDDGGSAASKNTLSDLVRPFQDDTELRIYIAAPVLLISTALAPPFLVMLGGDCGAEYGNLGLLLLASSVAAIDSSCLRGALSERSSRQTFILAGLLASLSYVAGCGLGVRECQCREWCRGGRFRIRCPSRL